MRHPSCIGYILLLIATNASANPEGGEVVAGSAAVSSKGALLEVQQRTDRTIIEWKKFDIAAHEHTKFIQPSANSVVLNRVRSDRASEIMGKLTANGKVVIVNPNGVRFGKDATVDVNGLIAATGDIANSKFMEGGSRLEFNQPGSADAAIINEGHITAAEAGLVGLVAPSVMNSGIIEAKLGKVELASGDVFAVDLYGNNLVQLELSNEVKSQIIANSGSIEAGTIAITAAAAKELVDSLIIVAGELKAPVATEEGGVIKISGAENVIIAGKVDASNNSGKGRSIEVTGKHVALLDGAELNASGQHGGGDIKVGGDYLGQGDTPTAETTYVAKEATIYNDAIESGDGGRTIVWSDDTTEFHGTIYGRGGEQSGDGGFVETSGKQHLIADGDVDLTAPQGNKGTYLLDPDSIAIYGNVDPLFTSSDSSINLSNGLRLWLDAADRSKVTLTYSNDSLSSAAVDRTSSNTLETTTNINITSALRVGARVRVGAAGGVATVPTMGANTFTIASISYDGSKTIITTVETIPTAYSAQALYRGLVSRWDDKSGAGKNASQTTQENMPLWVGGAQNNRDEIGFLGDDGLIVGTYTIPDEDKNGTLMAVSYSTVSSGEQQIMGAGNQNNTRSNRLAYTSTSNVQSHMYQDGGPVNYSSFSVPGASRAIPNIPVYTYDNVSGRKGYFNSELKASNATIDMRVRGDISTQVGFRGTTTSPLYLTGGIMGLIVSELPLSNPARNLLEQYQSAQWNIALVPPGTGATEAAKAMASNGYSVFASQYLEKLSQSSDVALQATNNITLDLKGGALTMANDQSISLTSTAGNIVTASNGAIVTNRTTTGGNITFSAAGDINVAHALTLEAQNDGRITLTATGGAINSNSNLTLVANAVTANSKVVGGLTWQSDAPTSASFAAGTDQLTFQQKTAANTLGVGTGGTPGTSITNAIVTAIKTGFGSYVFGRSNGGAITNYTTTWDDPVAFLSGGTFTNSATVTTANDFTATANVVSLANSITSSGSLSLTASNGDINAANAITLTAADITLSASGNVVTNNQLTIVTDDITASTVTGNMVWQSDTPTAASFAAGTDQLIFQQKTAANTLGVGTGGTPGTSITNAIVTAIKTGFGSYSFGRSAGGSITNYTTTWDDPVTFLSGGTFTNSATVTTANDFTVTADVVSLANSITSSGSLSLTASNGDINAANAVTLTAADITLSASGNVTTNDQLTVATNNITSSAITGALTWRSDNPTSANFVANSSAIIFEQLTTANSLGIGTGGAPGVTVSDALVTYIASIFNNYTFGRSNGGNITNYITTWDDPVTFLSGGTFTNSATVTTANDFTATANVVSLANSITSSGSLSLTASNGDINAANAVTLTAADITLSASGNVVTNNQLTIVTDDITASTVTGNMVWQSDTPTAASFAAGTDQLIFQQKTAANTLGVGTGGVLDVSIPDAVVSAVKIGFGSYGFGRSAGGSITNYTTTWDDPVTFLSGGTFTNSATVTTANDFTVTADVVSLANSITSSGSLSLTASNGDINAANAVTLTAADITLSASGNVTTNDQLTVATDDITASSITGNMVWQSDAPTSASFTAGTDQLTFQQKTAANTLGVGTGGVLDVSIPDAVVSAVKIGFGSYGFGRSAGGSITNYTTMWDDPVTFLSGGTFTNSATVTTADNFTATANVVSLANSITSSGSLSLTASNGDINAANAITLTAADITLSASGNVVTNNQLTIVTDDIAASTVTGNMVWQSDTPTAASFAAGTDQLLFQQKTAANTLGVGTGGALDVSILDAVVSAVKIGFGSYSFGRSAGGSITNYTTTWDDPVTFLTGSDFTNAVATSSNDTIFVNAGRDITLNNAMATTSASSNALRLVAGRNLVNNAGASALTANNSRWLVYSANVNNSTNAAILDWDFRRYGCSYSGGCASGISIPTSGNGLIYSTRPSLSISTSTSISKLADGTTGVTINNPTFSGVIPGDNLTIGSVTANFADKNIGTHKPIYTVYSLSSGSELGYSLQAQTLYGDIIAPVIPDHVRWFSQNADQTRRREVNLIINKATGRTSSQLKLRDMLEIDPRMNIALDLDDWF